jgi:hypothetical protein
MDGLLRVGRLFFAAAIALFGIEYFIYAAGIKGPMPGPPWIPSAYLLAWLTGLALFAIAVFIPFVKLGRFAASLLGVALLLDILFFHAPGLLAQLHNPGPWTSTFELLALCGGAFVLVDLTPADAPTKQLPDTITARLATAGRLLFAIALVVFAVQHFLYARFIATLIPVWIPGHLFWAYFVGVAFIGAALALATKVQARLTAALLGTMFLLWVVVLHLPRVAHAPRNGDELTSLLIALAMSGISFILAASFAPDTSV